ncbi:DUF3231 family protein [Cytobacillus firmus]|nr:DUF3231 family protein [Cytobacillus firmus]
MTENQVHLTTGEMGVLWTGYQNDSMSLQLLDYFLRLWRIVKLNQ